MPFLKEGICIHLIYTLMTQNYVYKGNKEFKIYCRYEQKIHQRETTDYQQTWKIVQHHW